MIRVGVSISFFDEFSTYSVSILNVAVSID